MVVLGVTDLDAATTLFQQAYGWLPPLHEKHKEFGAKMAHFSGTPVVLAAPLDNGSWLAERLEQFGESPVALMLGTQDFDSAVDRFKLSQQTVWFGQRVAWFNSERLGGVRLGVVGQ
jgi:hypothetical protein